MAEPIRTLRDAEVRLGRLRQEWDSFVSKSYDRHGLRFINNGRSRDSGDYVIRGEVNDLIINALVNADKLELNQVFQTIVSGGGGTGLQNPLVESLLVSQDNKYDIGTSGSGKRVRNGFADVWNGEQLEITDPTTHTAHWKIKHGDGVGNLLNIVDASSEIIAQFRNAAGGFTCIFHQHLIPDGNDTFDIGSSTQIWQEFFVKDITIGKSTATRIAGHLEIANATDSDVFQLNGIAGGDVQVAGDMNFDSNRRIVFDDAIGTDRAVIGVSSDAGFVTCNASGGSVLLVTSATAGNNSVWINSTKILGPQATAIADVTGTADATYSSNETDMINDLKTQLNDLLAKLRTHGIIDT